MYRNRMFHEKHSISSIITTRVLGIYLLIISRPTLYPQGYPQAVNNYPKLFLTPYLHELKLLYKPQKLLNRSHK